MNMDGNAINQKEKQRVASLSTDAMRPEWLGGWFNGHRQPIGIGLLLLMYRRQQHLISLYL